MVHTLLRRVSPAAAVAFLAASLLALPVAGQTRRANVRVQENLRAEPNGVVIAVVEPGTALQVVREQGNWVEAILEGWVWTQSLRTREGGAYDYQVGVPGGENLRARPQGEVVARLEEGALLVGVDRAPGWIRVQRQAWIWKPSVTVVAGSAASAPERPAPAAATAPSAFSGTFRSGAASPLLASPDGDTLTVLRPGTELPITARQGNWARVRVEGWVWIPGGEALEGAPAEVDPSITLADVVREPAAYSGRMVTWELQFVSLEEAEAVRTDFYEGEPFLLTRPLGDESTRFVYVAVPPDQLAAAGGLAPLERITVTGRIRAGASSLTGAPILDLVEFRRRR
jgi:hypothetical protein